MAANTAPIYVLSNGTANSGATLTTANTAKDGSGTVATVFTADATNGGYIRGLRITPKGTNVQTVLRVFVTEGTSQTPARMFSGGMTIFATTNTETARLDDYYLPMDLVLAPGTKVNCTLGTTVAGGIDVYAVGGQF
jgi:hypothetical protein